MNFKVTKSDIIFKGHVFDLKVDKIEYDSGNKGVREVAIHNGGAVVLPVTNENKIVFVSQFRYPFQKFLLELPAGKLEVGEDPKLCASRELTEETGYTTKKISKLGEIYTTPGFCSEVLYIYMAEDIVAGEHSREEGEHGMEVHEFTIKEVQEKIRNGEIVDAKTICAIQYLSLHAKFDELV